VLKIAIAAGVLPAAWHALARAGDDGRRGTRPL
jgi:hypothetical protein